MGIVWQWVKNVIGSIFRYKKISISVIVIAVVAWILTKDGPNYSLIKTASVERQSIASEVVASGEVDAEKSVNVHFPIAGKLTWIGVEEGQKISKYQAVATIDKERYEIALRQADQEFIAAKAATEKVYDETGRKTAESFSEKVKRTAAEADQNQAYDAIKKAERDLKDTTLLSPISGTVLEIPVETGEEVISTTTIATIADLSSLRFVSEVDETDIGKVSVDQKATILLDAFPDREIASTVTKIGKKKVTTSTGATAFEVEFTLTNLEEYRIGMNGEATVTTDKKADALVVPVEAVQDETIVWVKTGRNTYTKKKVMQGISSDTMVAIISGLSVEDVVVVDGFDEIGKKTLLDQLLKR